MNKISNMCACHERRLLIQVKLYAKECHNCHSSRIFMTVLDKITNERDVIGSGTE